MQNDFFDFVSYNSAWHFWQLWFSLTSSLAFQMVSPEVLLNSPVSSPACSRFVSLHQTFQYHAANFQRRHRDLGFIKIIRIFRPKLLMTTTSSLWIWYGLLLPFVSKKSNGLIYIFHILTPLLTLLKSGFVLCMRRIRKCPFCYCCFQNYGP